MRLYRFSFTKITSHPLTSQALSVDRLAARVAEITDDLAEFRCSPATLTTGAEPQREATTDTNARCERKQLDARPRRTALPP